MLQGDLGTGSSSSDSSASVPSSVNTEPGFLSLSSSLPLGILPILGLHGNLPSTILSQNGGVSSFSSPEGPEVANSLALVPSMPLFHVIVLRVWSFCMEQSLEQNMPDATDQVDGWHAEHAEQPSPNLSAFNTLSLPRRISRTRTLTPLVSTSLRRSARLNPDGVDVQHVRLPYAPKKRRQQVQPESVDGLAKRKLSLNDPPQPDGEVPQPIPTQTLHEWGLYCNVPPEELTDSVLLSGRAKMIPNDDEDMEE